MPMKVRYSTIDGEIIAEKRDGVRRTYVPDPLGSTRALLDSNQQQTDRLDYWPYGEQRTRTGTTPIPFKFVGTLGYYAAPTRHSYVRARVFSQGLGIWQQRDPYETLNEGSTYRYAENNPTSQQDPSGRKSRGALRGGEPGKPAPLPNRLCVEWREVPRLPGEGWLQPYHHAYIVFGPGVLSCSFQSYGAWGNEPPWGRRAPVSPDPAWERGNQYVVIRKTCDPAEVSRICGCVQSSITEGVPGMGNCGWWAKRVFSCRQNDPFSDIEWPGMLLY